MLDMMAQTLKVLEDPDWEILTSVTDSYATGVPVGYKEPIARIPDVFPERLIKNWQLTTSLQKSRLKVWKRSFEKTRRLV